MELKEFISGYSNHPVLFIGSGFSFRYLKKSFTWNALLSRVCEDLWGNDEQYLDIKASCTRPDGYCSMEEVASQIEKRFNKALEEDRDGRFKSINDIFYDQMRLGNTLSRFKIYISQIVQDIDIKEEMIDELNELKKARKNIGSIITTNYDKLIETIFDFNPLVGNDILLSNPYGSIYKIHGCVGDISKIIITTEDYKSFDERYDLIRAQMLSIFIHNPIIFIGYSINDENIKKVLKTIFSYIPANTPEAEKVRRNFLLVDYERGSNNLQITDHDIVVGSSNIRINRLKTDDFTSLYKELANIVLPISAMDVRKVQSIVKEIYAGGNIKVMITESLDETRNSDRILAIGSPKTISYQYMTTDEMMVNYFTIIEEANSALLALIDKQRIAESQYFPIFGFYSICNTIKSAEKLKEIQIQNVTEFLSSKCSAHKNSHTTIQEILSDSKIAISYKHKSIMYALQHNHILLDDVEIYLKTLPIEQRKSSDYRRLLCLYDMKKYQ